MPSLSAKDRVSLCQFSFADGRRCRTPRTGNHPHFCFDHAQKEARSRSLDSLGKDLAYFFSGNYLSACDLSTALARIIPAILRGDVKPRAARTVAYMAQTLAQSHQQLHQRQPQLPLPTRPPAPTRGNLGPLSFRAQRGTCFFLFPCPAR